MLKGRIPIFVAISLGAFAISQAQSTTQSDPQLQTRPAAPQADAQSPSTPASSTEDPLKRQLSDKERRSQQKELKQELKGPYKKWVDQDVHWIITDQELKAFKSLSNDEERDAFIEAFWQRRNPNPDSPENEFREEHYRRIEYANEHFAAGKPGWKTDRGHMYIAYGKPDSIDSHPSGGTYDRPMDEGGGTTSTYPFETWHYRYIEGIGENIDIEFVDTCMCGDYHMTIDRSEKDALLHVPGAGQTMYEQMGMAKQSDRFRGGLESLGNGPMAGMQQSKQFDRLEQYAKLQAPPVIKFKDLELESFMSNHKLMTGPYFPFDVRTDYVKVTDDTVLVPITLQIKNRDITFNNKDGIDVGEVHIIGRVSTITGKIVQSFEDTVEVEVPTELLTKTLDNKRLYWKSLPLRPGRYRVDIGIKDVNNPDHLGVWAQAINVPKYDEDKLSASSLILANRMELVPSKEIGAGNFVIGNTKLLPAVTSNPTISPSFQRTQKLNFWMQVYNLGIDEKSKQNSATIQYQIIDLASNKAVLDMQEDSKKLSASSDQVTLERSVPLANLQPGKYQIRIKVNDSVSNQEIAQSAPFTVE
ncbi:GWxTD domain-containing protein [Alloacidobacterium dinghuense]|uniref:GWxTD domain-containing protein n=1 Tax=Alloacidobacterium dinghuense TaxID=2763107 RepID=A0A7G8BCK7_9BACT|nr:GWxTD domain-containing protein [Alloacidobacterium dinghuense]QNI30277.1 GWxTD domain-containing protein [Alloacidobacterium dinghuense]